MLWSQNTKFMFGLFIYPCISVQCCKMAAKCYNSLDTNFTCHSFIQVYLWHTCKEKSVEKFKIWHKKVRITLWQNIFWNHLLCLLLGNNKIKDLTIDNKINIQCNLDLVTLESVTTCNLVATLAQCRKTVMTGCALNPPPPF